MDIFTVSFFGHRQITCPETIETALEHLICELLKHRPYVDFLVGRSGDFDLLTASVIRRCKKIFRDDNSSLILVLPYMTAEYANNESSFLSYYDEVEICPASDRRHFKAAYQIRNRTMVDRSDLVVFCVEHPSGGAYQTMLYTGQHGIPYINIAEKTDDPGFAFPST